MEETTKIQINMAKLQSDVEHIKDNLDAHMKKEDEHLEEFKKLIKEFMENSDKRYSGKWIEKIVVRVGITIVGVVVPAILYLTYQVAIQLSS